MTELIGDIVIQCIGGTPLAPGAPIPTANITVSLATGVTSRLIPTGANPSNTSEALLLIDEPNTDLRPGSPSGAGPASGFVVCGTAAVGASATGCVQSVSTGVGAALGQSCTGPAAT